LLTKLLKKLRSTLIFAEFYSDPLFSKT
jgi:hypothetical protein